MFFFVCATVTTLRQKSSACSPPTDKTLSSTERLEKTTAALELECVTSSQQAPDLESKRGPLGGCVRRLEANSGRGVHSSQQRHSLAAALHSSHDFAAGFD